MIKTFISHASEDDFFVERIEKRLERENIGLDVFVDHRKNRPGDDAQAMIDEVKKSVIFIPVITKYSKDKEFVKNEIETALETSIVNLFPVKIHVEINDIPEGIKTKFEKCDEVKGILCVDFSNEQEWEIRYQELKEAIFNRLTELDLLQKDENFYQDIRHIDLILKREKPTPAEIKSVVNVYLMKEAYLIYFFKRLENLEWLKHLYNYGLFRRNPEPVEIPEQTGYYRIPYWHALGYLEKISEQITEETDERHGNIIMEVIRSHSPYNKGGERVENYHTDHMFIKIMSNLPQKYITLEDIKQISNYFETQNDKTLISSEVGKSLLPKLLENNEKEKAVQLLEVVIRNKWKGGAPVAIMEEYWFNKLMDENREGICELFPLKATEIILKRISEIVTAQEHEFDYVQIAAIEDHPQNTFPDRYQNVLIRAVRDFISRASKENPENVKDLIGQLLHESHPIFRRLAIHTISTNWNKFSYLLWESFDEKIFDDHPLKHAVYELLKNNFESFTEEQKSTVVDWIENCDYWSPEEYREDEKKRLTYLAHTKQEWFYAIKNSEFQKAGEKYDYYRKITNTEPEHPGFSFWMGDVQVGSISPIDVEELLKKSNEEISHYLKEYKGSREWFGKPSKEGLRDALWKAVKRDPSKFSSDLKPFLEVPQEYQHKILWGFAEAWKGNKEFDWNPVLIFCQQIISKEDFWSRNYAEDEPNYREYIIMRIADLIEGGTRNDGHCYDEKYLQLTEEIILTILPKVGLEISYPADISMSVINSAKGLTLTAAIVYSLRYARLNKESEDVSRWPESIKEEFTKRLDKDFDDSPEFSFILGKFLPNLMYLDKEWVEGNISQIFPLENQKQWKPAMEGYLLYSRVSLDIYRLIKEGGHYLKSLETNFEKKEVGSRLIQHVCIGFLNGIEDITSQESLMHVLLDDWKTEDISEMISFFWMLRRSEELPTDQREKILLIGGNVFNHYKNKSGLSVEDKEILASCGRLAVFLDRIDETSLEWLKFSAKYLDHSFRSFFIEYLDKLVDESPHEVGLVYLEMLENDIYPDYDKVHIKSTIQKLYSSGEKDIADKICNLYGSENFDFLREIYDGNN